MTHTSDDILNNLRDLRKDLTAAQAKITDAINAIAGLNLPTADQATCVECNIRFRGPLSLAEHQYNHHNGPVPVHYLAAENHADNGLNVEALSP